MNYSSKLKSNLIGKEYEYKTVNLLELREEIIKQEGLSMFDIVKGFHGNNEIKLSYNYEPMYKDDQERDRVIEILKKALSLQKEYIVEKTSAYITEKFEKVKAMLESKLEGSSYEKVVSIENLLDMGKYHDMDRDSYNFLKTIIGVKLIDELDSLSREFRTFLHIPDNIEKESEEIAANYVNEELKNSDFFLLKGKIYDCEYKALPTRLKLDKELIEDFKGYCYNREEDEIQASEIDIEKNYGLRVKDFTYHFPYIGEKQVSFYCSTNIMKKLPEKDAKILFIKGIKKALEKENSMSPMCYYQELESNPITISIDTQTKKITLIDGYKRLLYTTNEELLNKDVVVRVFQDISDKELLTLLFAENSWKTLRNRSMEADFHDRGFLFCLKQRFGIEYSDTLMKVLCLYDKVGYKTTVYPIDKIMSSTPSIGDVRDIATKNEHFVKDVVVLRDFLDKASQDKYRYPYQDNIRDYLSMAIVSLVGYIRRKSESADKELTVDILEKAMLTDKVTSAFYKKKYSSDTYIDNNFRDNDLKDALLNYLKESLENDKELDEEVDMGR